MEMQYCELGKHWAPKSEFYDERKGYHGNRRWCKRHTSAYYKKLRADKKKLLRKLVRFWNKNHKKQIALPG